MNSISPKLTIRTDQPVEPELLELLRKVSAAAQTLRLEFFIAGALARDLILRHVYDKEPGRATRDVDLGILIQDWSELESLRQLLTQNACFTQRSNMLHRLDYHPEAGYSIPLDLLPFGGVAREDGTIAWPPGMDVIMSVAGFSEACRAAIPVFIRHDLTVQVASPAGLAILKLIAWEERRHETTKDATDLLLLARYYADAGNEDRLYDEATDLLKKHRYDPVMAGAALLGRDMSTICTESTRLRLKHILTDTRLWQQFQDQLLRASRISGLGKDAADISSVLDAFRQEALN